MAFWHEERFGMRKCAVSQKYFYKLARNMATRKRITWIPLAFYLHFYIIEKEIKETERLLSRTKILFVFFFILIKSQVRNFALLQAVIRDLLIAAALINCHRNSLYQSTFSHPDYNVRHTSSLNARSSSRKFGMCI